LEQNPKPKKLGGLGVLDLAKFNQALRLRWQWLKWKDSAKPWSQLRLPHNAIEAKLFKVCTKIWVGNGQNTKFWDDRWLQDQAPSDLAPALFRWASRKNITVAEGLAEGKWMSGLKRIVTTEEISQFVALWCRLIHIQLTSQHDSILWRFSASGQYSASSAYAVQFAGSCADFEWDEIWRARVKNKCKFFSWLILHNKLWTLDRINKHGGKANAICQLCRTHLESSLHLMAQCPYSKAVWDGLSNWLGFSFQPPPNLPYRRLKTWWHGLLQKAQLEAPQRQEHLQRLIYVAWNIWKERCH
jgi:hypothetical protein